jgi:hypothetical protein
MGGSDSVEFPNVEVLAHNEQVVLCRVAGRVVTIPAGRLLPGSTARRQGDVGTVVLTREIAKTFALL